MIINCQQVVGIWFGNGVDAGVKIVGVNLSYSGWKIKLTNDNKNSAVMLSDFFKI